MGHLFVMPHWNRLAPTNTVIASAHWLINRGLASNPRANDTRTNMPAKRWT